MKNTDATVFRAGVWKPRQDREVLKNWSYCFAMVARVKKETGMLIAVEVANLAHVKLALEADIDILWLGARTTVNPLLFKKLLMH